MWDAAAKTMAVNVIAKVEGGGAWDAINYNDPITLGLMQWFGTRAADLLTRIKTDHPTEYATIAGSLRADHTANADTSRYWTSRYLTRAEGNTVKPVLRASKDTQGALVASDVDDYKAVCDRIGLDADANTNTAIFFMCMYHQTPTRAINLMKRIGLTSNLDRTWQACVNEVVFSRYKTRYTTAYNIIKSGVPPEIIDLNDDNEEQGDDSNNGGIGPDPNGQESIFDTVRTGIKFLTVVGDQIVIHTADNKNVFAVPTANNRYIIKTTTTGETVEPKPVDPDEEDLTPSPDPDPPTGDEAEDTRNKIVKFMKDRIGKYGYSQGPGRLTPDTTGVTDCSALTRFAYLSITGKDIGTYTDAQVTNKNTRVIAKGGGGDAPDEAIMKKGDLIITGRYGISPGRIASHVEIYIGNNQTIGHGGVPYMGPVIKPMRSLITNKKSWWIKRLNGL